MDAASKVSPNVTNLLIRSFTVCPFFAIKEHGNSMAIDRENIHD